MKSWSQPQYSIVFFDLETTGLDVTDEITQIAAKCGNAMYNQYVIPSVPIPQEVTDLTGIRMIGPQMYVHGQPVNALAPAIAAITFTNFLANISGRVILIAHNCFYFDGPILTTLMARHAMMHKFRNVVAGFSDSLPLLKWRLPAVRCSGRGYKLADLAKEYLGNAYGAHDAKRDVIMLEDVVRHPNIDITADDIIRNLRMLQ